MKNVKNIIALFLVLLLTFSLSAQKREAWKIVGLYSSSIMLDAVGDGLNDSGHKELGHACNAMSTAILITSPFNEICNDKIYSYERKRACLH